MNEQQRQQYLDAMGIQPWYPRYILPEAKPSTTCEWDWEAWEAEHPPAAVAEQPQHSAEQAVTPAPFKPAGKPVMRPADILGETPEQAVETTTETPAENVTVQSKPVKPAERFRLVTLSVDDDCLVVSELPSTGMNQFTRFHERLLRNLLFSVGIPIAPALQPALFDWPIAGNRADQDEQAAHDAVHGYLTNQFGLRRRKTLFLLGRNCVRYALGPETDFDEVRGIQDKDQQITVITHSLDALMKLPAIKADTWRDISPLLTRNS
ncbi:hypothetical protein GCM10023116_41320 [Kistimonas scapharcae]|uniref:Uracil-DNA glycosylase-like domain-containing protein n=1 Tax=Kistimonas scapharcae TaxID=1036133 RepID=A0ABP8V8J4_9GAMM